MGSINTKDFREILEEEYPPETPTRPKRVLAEDPRSPSTLITRTPIQVAKTPESVLDPRSPTAGITRTPIYGKTVSKKAELLVHQAETPLRPEPTDDTCEQAQDENVTEPNPSASEELIPQTEGDSPPTEGNTSPERLELEDTTSFINKLTLNTAGGINFAAISVPPIEPVDPSEQFIIKRRKPKKISRDDPNVTSGQRSCKVKATGSTRSPLRSTVGDSQRSPLAMRNMDLDSPRVIVQRKLRMGIAKGQMGPIANLRSRSPAKYQKLTKEDDKENTTSSSLKKSKVEKYL